MSCSLNIISRLITFAFPLKNLSTFFLSAAFTINTPRIIGTYPIFPNKPLLWYSYLPYCDLSCQPYNRRNSLVLCAGSKSPNNLNAGTPETGEKFLDKIVLFFYFIKKEKLFDEICSLLNRKST